ncbi:cell division protein ZapA [Prolixibacteraceae bacterium JC049]|nr:cell division protein ZapA [Prolixibacteraceae bacterium JC049]
MEKKLSINLKIADRPYPLKINRDEEERIRKAAKIINEKILQYRQRYKGNDMQDLLAMTALQVVTQNIDLAEKADKKPFIDEVERLNNRITDFLREQ